MSYEQQLGELARTLVHPERFGDMALQDTIEFDSRAVIDAVWDAEIAEEKARIIASRLPEFGMTFGDPVDYGE